MPISRDKYPFTQQNVDSSPNNIGVYELYDGETNIYIAELQELILLESDYSHISVAMRELVLRKRLIIAGKYVAIQYLVKRNYSKNYERIHGKLPRCNERIG